MSGEGVGGGDRTRGQTYSFTPFPLFLFQLETRDVWAAWGLAQLRGRDYETAREKIKHALGAGASSAANQSLLTRIIDVLEECPAPTLEDVAFIQTQVKELQAKLKSKAKMASLQSTPVSSPAAGGAVQPGGPAINLYPASAEDVFAVNAVRLGKVAMESNLDSRRFFEGQYYLKTYGVPEALVSGGRGGGLADGSLTMYF